MKIVLHGRMLVSNLFNTPVVVGIAVDSSADGGAGGIQSGYTGDGPADPVAVRDRLWIPGTGAYQPHRGRGAAGLLRGLYGLPDQHGFRRAGIGQFDSRFGN